MSEDLEQLLESTYKLRKALEQVLPSELSDYIIQLVAKDSAHRKYLKIVEENENGNEGIEDLEDCEQNQQVERKESSDECEHHQQAEETASKTGE